MKQQKFKSPLRYPGGKTRLVKKIAPYIPKSFTEYREPFLGGGSMLFYITNNHPLCTKKVSDNFSELYNFWIRAKVNNDVLVDIVRQLKTQHQNGKALHADAKNRLSVDGYSHTCRAACFFILNRISFSGLTLSGGYSQAAYESRFKESHIKRLEEMEQALENVEILSSSYESLLSEPGNNVWVFLDPPYDIKTDNLYGKRGNQHKGFDHVKFADSCKKSPHRWLITYNDNERIRELFSWAHIYELPVTYNMNSNNKKTNELIITNYTASGKDNNTSKALPF
jgi:DNA adenine methylase